MIICDEVTDAKLFDVKLSPKDVETSFNLKKAVFKTQNFYILFLFSLITIALLITVSIYCYLINY